MAGLCSGSLEETELEGRKGWMDTILGCLYECVEMDVEGIGEAGGEECVEVLTRG